MTQKYKFAEGERVLCFHGPLIYEAKALKSTISKDKQIKYYIHYAGWSKNWDEWVPENRVLKYNEANVQRQNEVYKQHSASTKTKKGSAKSKKADTSGESRAITPSKDVSGTAATAGAASGTTPAGSRSNRSAKQAARATTPVSSKDSGESSSNKKDENITKDETLSSGVSNTSNAKDDNKEETQKKKRGGSHTSDKSFTTTASTTPTPPNITGGNVSTTAATSSSSATSLANVSSTGRLDSCVESEETFLSKIEVKIKIPEELKQCLTDDWDGGTRQRKLLEVPAKVTVQEIVDQYLAFKKAAKSTNATKEVAINDVLEGIIEYFNVMLGSQLLYKFERPQYAEILQKHPDTPPSQLYGSFHLLRLFVKLGSMLGYSALDEKAMQNLLAHIHDFLKFLVKNNATYFSMAFFVNADSAHYRQAQ